MDPTRSRCSGAPGARLIFWRRAGSFAAVGLIYSLLFLATTCDYLGDTIYYAQDIVHFDHGNFPGYPNPLWDPGHLYWRPLGWVLLKAFGGLTSYAASGEETLAADALLITFSALCGLICALAFYALAARTLGNQWKAILAATVLICFYAFLNYVHTGASYIPGLMGILLALWTILHAIDRGRLVRRDALLAGAFAALAILFWLPYLTALPGLFGAALLWNRKPGAGRASLRSRLPWIGSVAGFALLFTGLGYLAAVWRLGFPSFSELAAWFSGASHGWSQNRRLIRMVSGLARSFFSIGDDGLAIKRYVLKDPYAHETLSGILHQHLWRILAFYSLAVALVCALWRSSCGRRVLCIVLTAALPVLVFAVFILESGSAERYLPLYPFACLAIAQGVAQLRGSRLLTGMVLAFLVLSMTINIAWLWRPKVDGRFDSAAGRARSLEGKVSSGGLIALLTHRDEIYALFTSDPFHPVSRRQHLPVYDVIEPNTVRLRRWGQDFAKHALEAMNRPESVWVSKRFLAEQPDPSWGWAEGDNPAISWRDLRPFFSQYAYSESVGGSDGFLKLDASAGNLSRLEADSR